MLILFDAKTGKVLSIDQSESFKSYIKKGFVDGEFSSTLAKRATEDVMRTVQFPDIKFVVKEDNDVLYELDLDTMTFSLIQITDLISKQETDFGANAFEYAVEMFCRAIRGESDWYAGREINEPMISVRNDGEIDAFGTASNISSDEINELLADYFSGQSLRYLSDECEKKFSGSNKVLVITQKESVYLTHDNNKVHLERIDEEKIYQDIENMVKPYLRGYFTLLSEICNRLFNYVFFGIYNSAINDRIVRVDSRFMFTEFDVLGEKRTFFAPKNGEDWFSFKPIPIGIDSLKDFFEKYFGDYRTKNGLLIGSGFYNAFGTLNNYKVYEYLKEANEDIESIRDNLITGIIYDESGLKYDMYTNKYEVQSCSGWDDFRKDFCRKLGESSIVYLVLRKS